MRKITFAVCGMGNRGSVYAGQQLNFPDQDAINQVCSDEIVEVGNEWNSNWFTGMNRWPCIMHYAALSDYQTDRLWLKYKNMDWPAFLFDGQ